MSEPALPLLSTGAVVTPATVIGVAPGGVAVRSAELGERTARSAVAHGWTPQRGDQVLVIDDGRGQSYVVGVLRALREAAPGALDVGRADGVTRVVVADGDLELHAERGRVVLRGAEGVSVESQKDLSARARGAIAIESHDGERARSALRLDGDEATLAAGVLSARAAKLVVLAEEAHAIAARLDAHLDDVRQRATRIETRAVEVIEHLGDSYREVEGLAQTRAGRVRLVAEGAFSVLAERAKLKAKSIFAIDGDSIHLG